MTHNEQLCERYDDALAALVMEQLRSADGQRLLTQRDALAQDADAAVPEAARARMLQTIGAAQRKADARRSARKGLKWALRTAAVLAMLLALLAGACAVSQTVRRNVLGLFVEQRGVATDFRFSAVPDAPEVSAGTLLEGPAAYQPEGFVLQAARRSHVSTGYLYRNGSGDDLSVDAHVVSSADGSAVISIDTEDAEVTYETIGAQEVMVVQKRYAGDTKLTYQLAWIDESRAAMYIISSAGLPLDDLEQIAAKIMELPPDGTQPG